MEDDIYTFAETNGLKPERVVDPGSGISPLGPSGRVKAALRKAVKDVGMPPDPQQKWFRRLIFSRFGIPGERLVVSSSLRSMLFLAAQVIRPGRVLIAGPAPDAYAAAAAVAEAVAVNSFRDLDFTPDAVRLLDMMREGDMLMIANPNRITGRLMPEEEVIRLLETAEARGATAVLDESLMEFTGEPGMFSPQSGRTVVIRTTAFYHGLPGVELAYAVAPCDLAERLSGADHSAVSLLAIEAARASLKDKTYRRQAREYIEAEKRLFRKSLGGVPGVRVLPSDSNVFLLRVENGGDRIRAALLKEGFIVRDCSGMGLGREFLRLSVMAHGANRKFIRTVREAAGTFSGR